MEPQQHFYSMQTHTYKYIDTQRNVRRHYQFIQILTFSPCYFSTSFYPRNKFNPMHQYHHASTQVKKSERKLCVARRPSSSSLFSPSAPHFLLSYLYYIRKSNTFFAIALFLTIYATHIT